MEVSSSIKVYNLLILRSIKYIKFKQNNTKNNNDNR